MALILLIIVISVLVSCYFLIYYQKGERGELLKIGVILLAIFALLNPFIIKFGYGITNQELLGQTGDWLGGSSVPLLTFASFVLLIATFTTQKKELEQTNKALLEQQEELELTRQAHLAQNLNLEKQRVESAIFQGISLHNEIVNSMERVEENQDYNYNTHSRTTYVVTHSGRNVIKELYLELSFKLSTDIEHMTIDKRLLIIQSKYKFWYEENEHYIGHYYRNLYHLFKMIDTSILDPKEKEKYADIVRAQLSSSELLLLFYNAVSFTEENNFIPLIIRYNILKHINKSMLALHNDHHILAMRFNL
ncbi:hypothetical protein HP398_05370 [Brevibacillus sp. HB1.4B]|uniref:putative phage abortive infection protein n=1 Tax=Brevibacillus sp. HB1.4B TaxID=2738845 RepID=UPI00156B766F|nr:putative phage abortive infection protein [Brevibacillus sp. HB1.4B]NRS15863.1 hypothetical protein [Brevibacillus sp. HB1.4B]